jgi:hypothetical protein
MLMTFRRLLSDDKDTNEVEGCDVTVDDNTNSNKRNTNSDCSCFWNFLRFMNDDDVSNKNVA